MGRMIIGFLAGYIAMAAFLFLSFTLLYLILGTEGSFEPASYRVSSAWLVLSILLSIIAAVIGGYVCALISKSKKTAMVLAAVVLLLGIVMAIPAMGGYDEVKDKIREGSLSNTEAMQEAKQPDAILLLNPVIGALGVMLGARLWKEKKTIEVQTV